MPNEDLVFPVAVEPMSATPREELGHLLNVLLEAERAGAKLLAAYLDELPRGTGDWVGLDAVQRDEARNCAVLIHYLLEAQAAPSMATGDFYRKGLEIRGWRERLEFLNPALPHPPPKPRCRRCTNPISPTSRSANNCWTNSEDGMAAQLALKDTELIARILAGDMRALEALMRLYNRTLYRTARAILRDDAEAEDVVQEAYIRAYRALGTFRGESKLSTWLVRITANEALMRRRRQLKPDTMAVAVQREPVADHPGPEGEAQRGEARRLLERHIDALPDDYRAVFVLRALEELSVEETAAALGIPEATVRTRYFRARGLLREWMAGDVDTTRGDAFAFAGARCDRIVRNVLVILISASAAASLAACSEKPARPVPEGETASNSEKRDGPLRERTLKQGESGRMSY